VVEDDTAEVEFFSVTDCTGEAVAIEVTINMKAAAMESVNRVVIIFLAVDGNDRLDGPVQAISIKP
jgi:hypothetical protein